jgi:hypothetical protein
MLKTAPAPNRDPRARHFEYGYRLLIDSQLFCEMDYFEVPPVAAGWPATFLMSFTRAAIA